MKWLKVIRVEEDILFVKTLRGIEPVQKSTDSTAQIGEYALCESVNSTLMEVKA